ncbi:hypothetical protein J2D73_12100 [Acetobacter sacchari]|uniref:Uncharacterized protein n=1 Tax=Acetobacter sacchari TaxID=2661687 RepID=A0ABS3LX89_9PROT|nr:hypothetical protein [Acetobacter sacchari]MBO1360532.1 hypothetical protein [Acetobacter sacchari]
MNNTITPGIFSLNYNKDFLMNFDHFTPKAQDHATRPLNGKMNFSATGLQQSTYRHFSKWKPELEASHTRPKQSYLRGQSPLPNTFGNRSELSIAGRESLRLMHIVYIFSIIIFRHPQRRHHRLRTKIRTMQINRTPNNKTKPVFTMYVNIKSPKKRDFS